MRFLEGLVYHSARGFLDHLLGEVTDYTRIDGDLVSIFATDSPHVFTRQNVYWTRNVWETPFLLEFDSISLAAKALRDIQRNWAPCPTHFARRTMLIAEGLPRLNLKSREFPFKVPDAPMGAFTLLDEHTLMGSGLCSSPFPNGEFSFVEDKSGPPSRAYRKLWEALVLAGKMPGPGSSCIDAGASPGGWTWALSRLGVEVTAIDRAPLDPRIEAMPGIKYLKHDAFTLKPTDFGKVDWVFSDVICYPHALFDWISKWLESGLADNFVCTIKMQGKEFDKASTELFASIPGSKVLHLWHNRHELTWILTK
jgi:23S rRNA (cytidine2498-2'-O)-methyltransferase